MGGALRSLHTFDGAGQSFESLTATGPSFLNSLTEVGVGDGLWIFAEGPVRWEQPVLAEARAVSLSAGFNLVTWTGASGTPMDVALAGLGEALEVAFTYEAIGAVFAAFGPALPPFLNTAGSLQYGDGLWVKVSRAMTWSQPAPPPGGVFTSADGLAWATVPVGLGATAVVEALGPGELPAEVNGGATLLGYRVRLTADGTAGLRTGRGLGELRVADGEAFAARLGVGPESGPTFSIDLGGATGGHGPGPIVQVGADGLIEVFHPTGLAFVDETNAGTPLSTILMASPRETRLGAVLPLGRGTEAADGVEWTVAMHERLLPFLGLSVDDPLLTITAAVNPDEGIVEVGVTPHVDADAIGIGVDDPGVEEAVRRLMDWDYLTPTGMPTDVSLPVAVCGRGGASQPVAVNAVLPGDDPEVEFRNPFFIEIDFRVPCDGAPVQGPCSPDATTLCLSDDRFRVEAEWQAFDGSAGPAMVASETGDATGVFWFFSPDNTELVVKVLDACETPFNSFWVFAGGLTDVETTLRVTDTVTGQARAYGNPLGSAFAPVLDAAAFRTCGMGTDEEDEEDEEDEGDFTPPPGIVLWDPLLDGHGSTEAQRIAAAFEAQRARAEITGGDVVSSRRGLRRLLDGIDRSCTPGRAGPGQPAPRVWIHTDVNGLVIVETEPPVPLGDHAPRANGLVNLLARQCGGEGASFWDIPEAFEGASEIPGPFEGLGLVQANPGVDDPSGGMRGELGGAQAGGDGFVLLALHVAAAIPHASEEVLLTYAAVFDRDDDASNNFQALPQFALDFFQNTDMWYEAKWSPLGGWQMLRRIVIGGTPQVFATEGRVVIAGDTVFFVIPRDEFPASSRRVPFRMSAFVSDPSDPFGQVAGLAIGDTMPFVLDDRAVLLLP